MTTIELLLILFTSTTLLILIGLIVIVGKFNRLSRHLKDVYGEEHEMKKRIEQYVSRKTNDEVSKLMDAYKEALDTQSKEIIKSMKHGSEAHLESMEKFVREQEGLITRQTEFIVGAIVKKTQEDIDSYKQNQLEGVDAAIADIVQRLAPQVLGKSLSISEHEEFVWKALEDAKKQGIFQAQMEAVAPRGSAVVKVAKATEVSKVPKRANKTNKTKTKS